VHGPAREATFSPGDTLDLYTDRLVEALDLGGEEHDAGRLKEVCLRDGTGFVGGMILRFSDSLASRGGPFASRGEGLAPRREESAS
jgi:hypothetical protein